MNVRAIVPGERLENHSPVKPESLQWLDMASWDHAPIPERKWSIRDRVPLKQAGLFSKAVPARASSNCHSACNIDP